jgi:hypothetical protein
MPQTGCVGVLGFGHSSKSSGLSLVAGNGEKLRTRKNFYFAAVVMAKSYASHAGGDHTIRRDNDAIRTEEGDDDSHPRKTLFAFISEYRL